MQTACCATTGEKFQLAEEDISFYERISPVFNGRLCPVTPPRLSPASRLQRRLAFRNERRLYHRKSSLSGKQIVSTFHPGSPYIVYDQPEWWSDRWDAQTFGRSYDFSKPFTEQFLSLSREVPHVSLYTRNAENSYYTNYTLNLKNCYLIFGGANDEDCLYGRFVSGCSDCVDCFSIYGCELCYETTASHSCYQCLYCTYCRNCSGCLMIEDCESCTNCIMCCGLQREEYCILNQRVGRDRFEAFMQQLVPLTEEKTARLKERFAELRARRKSRSCHIYMSENCTGDMIFNSRNCESCSDINECEDCKYVNFSPKSKNSHDATYNAPDGVQFSYEVCSTVGAYSCLATFLCWYCSSSYYCMECHNSKNLFGCVGLRNKEYCLLNRQYSREAYEALVPRVIEQMRQTGEWGEYFSPALSFFGYNETIAGDHFPCAEEQARKAGFTWHREETGEPSRGEAESPAVRICSATGKAFKLIAAELSFYERMKIAPPTRCPEERYLERLQRRKAVCPRN